MKRASLKLFYVLMFLEVLAANMVHPVTPTLLTGLGMPSFMFGAAFAAMSATNFLFCPFWGRVGDSKGRVRTLVITILGYAGGQLLFLYAGTIPLLLAARLIAGLFAGGCTVCFMAYVADVAAPEACGRHMAVCAALTSAGTAAGYLVGGVLGDISVSAAFLSQFGLLCLDGVLIALFLADGPNYTRQPLRLAKAMNPLSAFSDAGSMMTAPMWVFLLVVFVSCFATTAYDNSFNYYLKEQFAFPPSYNGYIYAAVGVVGLLVNMTLGMWVQRNTDCRRSLTAVLTLCGVTLVISLLMERATPFIALNMLFYVFNSMYLPLQQGLVIRAGRHQHGQVSGVFSSIRAVGMVAGSLSAGFLYGVTPRLPLLVGAGAFLVAALAGAVNRRQYEQEEMQ